MCGSRNLCQRGSNFYSFTAFLLNCFSWWSEGRIDIQLNIRVHNISNLLKQNMMNVELDNRHSAYQSCSQYFQPSDAERDECWARQSTFSLTFEFTIFPTFWSRSWWIMISTIDIQLNIRVHNISNLLKQIVMHVELDNRHSAQHSMFKFFLNCRTDFWRVLSLVECWARQST